MIARGNALWVERRFYSRTRQTGAKLHFKGQSAHIRGLKADDLGGKADGMAIARTKKYKFAVI